MSSKITNTGFISDDDLVEELSEEETVGGKAQDVEQVIEIKKKPTRKDSYIFSEKRQQNLAKAREKKQQNKQELLRLKEKELFEKQIRESIERETVSSKKKTLQLTQPKLKKTKTKKIVYVEETSESESEEEVVVVRKKKSSKKSTPTPPCSPVKTQVYTHFEPTLSHDDYIRNLLRM